MSNKKRNNHLHSYPIIVLASGNDVDAINAVLKHYEGVHSCIVYEDIFYDKGGNPHLFVDDVLRHRLGTKLITKILIFNVA